MATRGTPHLATGKTWAPACNDEPNAHVLTAKSQDSL